MTLLTELHGMAGTRIGLAMATALVVLVLGGCAREDSASEVDPGEAASAEGTSGTSEAGGDGGSDGSSDSSGPGPDNPVDEPTLSLPGLPVGGNHYPSIDGNHPDNQCANVNWIVQSDAADLVSGIEVEVTGADFEPAVFTVASDGCDDDAPPCSGFVFTVDSRVCNLAVAPIPGSDTDGTSYRFALRGSIDCRQIGSERCRAFTAAVATEPSLSLELDAPVTGTGVDPDGDGGSTDESTDGATDGSTDGSTDEGTDEGTDESTDEGTDGSTDEGTDGSTDEGTDGTSTDPSAE